MATQRPTGYGGSKDLNYREGWDGNPRVNAADAADTRAVKLDYSGPPRNSLPATRSSSGEEWYDQDDVDACLSLSRFALAARIFGWVGIGIGVMALCLGIFAELAGAGVSTGSGNIPASAAISAGISSCFSGFFLLLASAMLRVMASIGMSLRSIDRGVHAQIRQK